MPKFKVVHLDYGREMRGGQWQALALMRGLRERGVDQTLLGRYDSPLGTIVREEELGWQRGFLQVAKDELFHAHDSRGHTVAALMGARPIVSRRVAFPLNQNWFSRWKYRRASKILAVSQFVERKLVEGGVEADRIKVIYDGVEPLPQASGHRIITPHFEDALKRTDLVMQAAKSANVEVHESKDLVRDLQEARGFVYITESEGLGSAILLAQSAGVPVIASKVGGVPEIVEHGRTGWLVENNVSSIATALVTLATGNKACELAAAGREQAHTRFSIDRMVDETLAVYREVARA